MIPLRIPSVITFGHGAVARSFHHGTRRPAGSLSLSRDAAANKATRSRTEPRRARFIKVAESDESTCFRGLEHEDVLLPAGRLQLRPIVGSVEQRVLRPGDHAGGPRGVPEPSWLIRRPATRRIRATSVARSPVGPSIAETGNEENVVILHLTLAGRSRLPARTSAAETSRVVLSFPRRSFPSKS